MFYRIMTCILMSFAVVTSANAETVPKAQGLDLSLPNTLELTSVNSFRYSDSMLLAAVDNSASSSAVDTEGDSKKKEPFKERSFTSGKVHKYLGLGSLGLALLAAVAPKEEDAPHEYLAQGAALLAGAAVATGLTYNYKDLHLDRGLKDPDNLHALLGTLGALAIAAAVSEGPESGHGQLGVLGTFGMGFAIKITW